MRVAAIPMTSVPFDWARNVARAWQHVEQCARQGAELALLPELFSVGYCYDQKLVDFAEPRDGITAQWMLEASRRFEMYVGGTFIEKHHQRVFDTFMLASPDGQSHFYRKRSLPVLERLFFHAGTDFGILDSTLGRIGVLICWDITSQTSVEALVNNIDLLLICKAWPDAASGSIGLPWLGRSLTRTATFRPAEIARLLGVPTIVCNMGGEFFTRIPFTLVSYRAPFVKSTSLISACGRIQSRSNSVCDPLISELAMGPRASRLPNNSRRIWQRKRIA